jgi:hypothetical protein
MGLAQWNIGATVKDVDLTGAMVDTSSKFGVRGIPQKCFTLHDMCE